MKKIFKNSSGNIVIQKSFTFGIVEMRRNLKEEGLEIIGYWDIDDNNFPEFKSIKDRFITTEYDFDIFKALKFGQKIAEILIETENEKNMEYDKK
jgi:hypothetical protein